MITNWDDFKVQWADPDKFAEEGNAGLEWCCDHVPPGMGIVLGDGTVL